MAKEFDLIPANKLCDMFRVEFDLYTPRAYLSILARDESIKTYYELDDEAKPKAGRRISLVDSHRIQPLKVCYFVGYAVKKSEEPRDNKSKFKALEAMIDYASQKKPHRN